jgi:hypothetical protein
VADEKVNLTIGLTDEISGPLKELVRNFDEYRTQLRQTSDAHIANLRVLLTEVERVNRDLGQAQTRAQAVGVRRRAALRV